MPNIICPKCGEIFQVDESGYARIASQVRDKEFEKELERRNRELEEKKDSEIKLLKARMEKERDETLTKKDTELIKKDSIIAGLQVRIEGGETEKKLAVTEALHRKEKELSEKETEITELKGQLKNQETQSRLREQSLKENHKQELEFKDAQIAYYKDFKARMSTKMVGESLEQHCLNQFNQIRTAFPNAEFGKDNDARSGSKGDFIYREKEGDTEIISIMFEMKNEMDTTAVKHKNEDFFKELDKDRREKNCEYAVLVSLLESDNEFYNGGIADVSYEYPKMYVIRPQCFIPMITILRNAAFNSLQYKLELAQAKNQQLDISNFEENLNTFKDALGKNYELAGKKFNSAIDEIDKTIALLNRVKDDLLSCENNLRLASAKADKLTIKKLTKNAPAVKEMFDGLNSGTPKE